MKKRWLQNQDRVVRNLPRRRRGPLQGFSPHATAGDSWDSATAPAPIGGGSKPAPPTSAHTRGPWVPTLIQWRSL